MSHHESDRVSPMLNPPHLGELIRESTEETAWSETYGRALRPYPRPPRSCTIFV